eukprot:6183382-Pleurochrysis_carterae.AAC.1
MARRRVSFAPAAEPRRSTRASGNQDASESAISRANTACASQAPMQLENDGAFKFKRRKTASSTAEHASPSPSVPAAMAKVEFKDATEDKPTARTSSPQPAPTASPDVLSFVPEYSSAKVESSSTTASELLQLKTSSTSPGDHKLPCTTRSSEESASSPAVSYSAASWFMSPSAGGEELLQALGVTPLLPAVHEKAASPLPFPNLVAQLKQMETAAALCSDQMELLLKQVDVLNEEVDAARRAVAKRAHADAFR